MSNNKTLVMEIPIEPDETPEFIVNLLDDCGYGGCTEIDLSQYVKRSEVEMLLRKCSLVGGNDNDSYQNGWRDCARHVSNELLTPAQQREPNCPYGCDAVVDIINTPLSNHWYWKCPVCCKRGTTVYSKQAALDSLNPPAQQ